MIVSGFIQFHISIGWTGVAFGFFALALRAPDLLNRWWRAPPGMRRTMETMHSVSGGMFIICSVFMPITANWIWPRFGTPYEVVWFITSMFLAMLLGIACIRLRRYLLNRSHVDEILASAGPIEADRTEGVGLSLSAADGEVRSNEGKERSVGVAESSNNDDVGLPLSAAGGEIDSSKDNERDDRAGTSSGTVLIAKKSNKKYLALKYLHAIFMTYSLVMLLGAGQAFLSNSRMNQFPYPRDEIVTDSLIGRCYGRNLAEPSSPSWLSTLACGLTSYCQESSRGGPNPFYHENGFI